MAVLGILAPLLGMIIVAWIGTFVRSDAAKSAQSAKDYSEALRAKSALVDALREELDVAKKTIEELKEKIHQCVDDQARQATIQRALEHEIELLKIKSMPGSSSTAYPSPT